MEPIEAQTRLIHRMESTWQELFGTDFGLPERRTICWWVDRYSEEIICHGIKRGRAKLAKCQARRVPFTLADAVRYSTSVMAHEHGGEFVFPKREAA